MPGKRMLVFIFKIGSLLDTSVQRLGGFGQHLIMGESVQYNMNASDYALSIPHLPQGESDSGSNQSLEAGSKAFMNVQRVSHQPLWLARSPNNTSHSPPGVLWSRDRGWFSRQEESGCAVQVAGVATVLFHLPNSRSCVISREVGVSSRES